MRPATAVGFALAALLAATPVGAAAQLAPGVHAVRANDLFAGADGLGARLALQLPGGFRLAGSGDWFFPECDGGCRYVAASLDLHVPLTPLPLVTPYGVAGWSWRRSDLGDDVATQVEKGLGVGLGLRVGSAELALYAEARYEFLSFERQWVGRVGLSF